jgi:hypothetical protein
MRMILQNEKRLASRNNGVGKREGEGQSRLLVPEMAMKDKWMFVALGYGLMLAALVFLLDAESQPWWFLDRPVGNPKWAIRKTWMVQK